MTSLYTLTEPPLSNNVPPSRHTVASFSRRGVSQLHALVASQARSPVAPAAAVVAVAMHCMHMPPG